MDHSISLRPLPLWFLVHLIMNLQTQVTQGQVTRSCQGTSLHKSLNARQSYIDLTITLKLSAIDTIKMSTKCISQNFDIGDLRSGQFCDLFILSQWEKIEKRLFWMKPILNTLEHRVTGRIDNMNRKIATNDPSLCPQGRSL